MSNIIKIAIIAFFGAIIFYGCSAENSKYGVRTLAITPNSISLTPLSVQKFACQANYNDGATRNFNPAWSVSDASIGTINKDGIFTASSNASAEGYVRAVYGSLVTTAEVKVIITVLTPQIPTNLNITEIKPYSAAASWDQSIADSYVISYGTDVKAENKGTIESVSNVYSLAGLDSKTTYYVKIAASNNVTGNNQLLSSYSAISSFNTGDFPLKYTISANKILNDKGNEFVFRGVNILDPADMDYVYKKVNDEYFSNISAWKANIIRIPIHPAYYKYYGSANCLNLLDQILDLAAKYKIYAILDYHSIGFAPDGTYMNLAPGGIPISGSIYAYTDQELKDFWSIVAAHYKNDDRVAFYEIFNEPTAGAGASDQDSWIAWRSKAEELTDIIRNYDPDSKLIVGGIDYAYDLQHVKNYPLNRQNIVYATHPYPNQTISWDTAFGDIKANYPVFATEFGFDPNAAPGIHYKADVQYGSDIINYLEAKKISWAVWSFSPIYEPRLLIDWSYSATISGSTFKTFILNIN